MITKFFIKRLRKKWEDEAKKRMENQILSENITANNNIYYIENSCYEQTLDVYYPKNTTEDLPALIVVHGGGLFSSSKDETRFYCYMLAEKGFVVFNINYRLVPKVYLQNQIEDVYNAFCWIENNSNKYPIKNGAFAVTGDSAGAYLALLATLATSSERLQKIYKLKNCSLRIKAASFPFGMFTFESDNFFITRLRNYSLPKGYQNTEFYKNIVLKDLPEMNKCPLCFLISSRDDSLYPMTFQFENLLKKNNITYELKFFEKDSTQIYSHDFCVLDPMRHESIQTIEMMAAFLKKFL